MITLRRATHEDLSLLRQFEQGVITTERPYDTFLKEDPIEYYDIGDLIGSEKSEIVVALMDNKIIGVGYAQIRDSKPYWKKPVYAYLGFMYVDPVYRGRGVNREIIEFLTKWSRTKGIYELRLDVYAGNQAAVRAYEKAGFFPHMIEMRLNLTNLPNTDYLRKVSEDN